MDYCKIYSDLVNKRKTVVPTGYTETHHILPRCLGGDDSKDNLVKLTAREHFMAHLLLTKCYNEGTLEYYKMVHAFFMMVNVRSSNQQRLVTSKKYEKLKIAYSEMMSNSQSGTSNSQYGKVWIHNTATSESKKILRSEQLPTGYVYGRSVKNVVSTCKVCSSVLGFKARSKYCSETCATKAKEDRLASRSKETEYTDLYNEYNSGKYTSIRQFAKTTNYSHVAITKNWKKFNLSTMCRKSNVDNMAHE